MNKSSQFFAIVTGLLYLRQCLACD